MLAAHQVIITLGFGPERLEMFVQAFHQALDVVTHHRVTIDQFRVHVPQTRAHGGKPGFQMEEDGAAAEKGFKVGNDLVREERFELRQQLRLAPGPFQEGLGFLKRCPGQGT
jgi:hypothetical protein